MSIYLTKTAKPGEYHYDKTAKPGESPYDQTTIQQFAHSRDSLFGHTV
jgi:hypothetical protein